LKKNSAILNGLNLSYPLTGVRINQSGIQTAQELFALASLKEKTTKLKI
jgi:short-subunit dehydrogenase involved in D-alanine esterification of teichoic acids